MESVSLRSLGGYGVTHCYPHDNSLYPLLPTRQPNFYRTLWITCKIHYIWPNITHPLLHVGFAILLIMQLKWDELTTRRKEAEVLEALIGQDIAIEPLLLGDAGEPILPGIRVLHIGELIDVDEGKDNRPYVRLRISESYTLTDDAEREPQPVPSEPQIFYLESVNGWSPLEP